MRETSKTTWGTGSFVVEVMLGEAAEEGHTCVRVTRYGALHSAAQGRVSAMLSLITAHQMQYWHNPTIAICS
jgi:hypothetical protein